MTLNSFLSKFKSLYLWGNLAAMALVTFLMLMGVKFGLEYYTHHGEIIEVPDLKGMRLKDAVTLLTDMGLDVQVTDSSYNKKLAPGCVLVQNPVAGTGVKQRHMISLTINTGTSPKLTIPDIIDNCSRREAEARLEALGFHILEPQRVHGEKDWVYGIVCHGRNVYTGEHVPSESSLILQVGDGFMSEGFEDDDYDDDEGFGPEEGDEDDFKVVTGPEPDTSDEGI